MLLSRAGSRLHIKLKMKKKSIFQKLLHSSPFEICEKCKNYISLEFHSEQRLNFMPYYLYLSISESVSNTRAVAEGPKSMKFNPHIVN